MFSNVVATIGVVVLLSICASAQEPYYCSSLPANCNCFVINETATGIACYPTDDSELQPMLIAIGLAIGNSSTVIDHFIADFSYCPRSVTIFENLNLDVRFRKITVSNVVELNYFDENAFPSTYEYTEILEFLFVMVKPFQEAELFNFVRSFQVLTEFTFQNGNVVIPDLAFVPMPKLRRIVISDAGVVRIDKMPFSSLPSLEFLAITNNPVTLDSIASDSFDGMNPNAQVDLSGNRRWTHLEEHKFDQLLLNSQSTVIVGHEEDEETDDHLLCNNLADWICQNAESLEPKLIGYNCVYEENKDVFDYCREEIRS